MKEVERDAERSQAVFAIQAEFAEAEEIFANVFRKVAVDKLLASVVKQLTTVGVLGMVESRALSGQLRTNEAPYDTHKLVGQMGLHSIMHDGQFVAESLNVLCHIEFQSLQVN